MKVNVRERLALNQVLPKEGDFATLKSLQEARTNILLSEEEVKEFEYKQEGNTIKWNEKGQEEREIEVSEIAINAVKDELNKLNDSKKLNESLMPIYEKLVEGK